MSDRPPWLSNGPWKALRAESFELPCQIAEDETVVHNTRVLPVGPVAVPSGELVATSLIMELEATGDCGGYFVVPAGTYQAFVTLRAGSLSVDEEAAYLSLVREGVEPDGLDGCSLSVLERVGGEESNDELILFVDKYLLALADRQGFLARRGGVDRDEWLDPLMGDLPWHRLTGDGVVQSYPVPNGIMAAVASRDPAGELQALHFHFFVVGSTGEDGEYDD